MSFELVEKLKKQYTDKFVEVDSSVPELKRFQGLTGVVKTVNMGGRALVQFEHPVDISWYDIEPSYLKLVDKPVKKAEPAKHAEKPAAEAKPAAAKPAGKSPLEMARAQGAAGAAAKPAAPAGDKPLSKIELARQQAAAGAGGVKPVAAAPTGDKPLSKIELARLQAAGGAAKPAAAAPQAATPAPASTPHTQSHP